MVVDDPETELPLTRFDAGNSDDLPGQPGVAITATRGGTTVDTTDSPHVIVSPRTEPVFVLQKVFVSRAR